jgi:hypothetical protein
MTLRAGFGNGWIDSSQPNLLALRDADLAFDDIVADVRAVTIGLRIHGGRLVP